MTLELPLVVLILGLGALVLALAWLVFVAMQRVHFMRLKSEEMALRKARLALVAERTAETGVWGEGGTDAISETAEHYLEQIAMKRAARPKR